MSGLATLGIALAGGSAGASLTLLVGVPEQVRQHDSAVAKYDDDLGVWVADECVRLERELNRYQNEMAAAGHLYDGAYVAGIAHRKEEALHHYRDQERGADQKRGVLKDAEGWRHRVWRRAARRGSLPELATPGRAEPILNAWRGDAEFQGSRSPVSDPTKRSLDWAVDKYGQ